MEAPIIVFLSFIKSSMTSFAISFGAIGERGHLLPRYGHKPPELATQITGISAITPCARWSSSYPPPPKFNWSGNLPQTGIMCFTDQVPWHARPQISACSVRGDFLIGNLVESLEINLSFTEIFHKHGKTLCSSFK
jgi:hypothetical protein